MAHRRLLAEIYNTGERASYERGKFSRREHDALMLAFVKDHGPLTVSDAARLSSGVLLVSEVRKSLKRLTAEKQLVASGTEYKRIYSIAGTPDAVGK